jgi:hypothetical protein
MSMVIAELMKSSDRGIEWLRAALQSAIELELSTLPPYLCGYWCLKDSTSYPAVQLNNIFFQEMLHFGLACNLLSATGGQPDVLAGYDRIRYPGPLPGGVVPACDGGLVPCDPNFEVRLGFSDFQGFAWMATQIEYPEDPAPRPALLIAAETFPTIGQFYDAILQAFKDNTANIPYDKSNQVSGPLHLTVVDNLDAAATAIQLIQQQGEGGSKYPVSAPGVLSHFYSFGELFYLKKYRFDAATQTGDWNGDQISIPDGQVFPMTPVPEGGYASPPSDVTDFDGCFTQMLKDLDSAWSAGSKMALSKAISLMPTLSAMATSLLGKQIQRPDGSGIYGPQFRITTSPPPVICGN